MLIIDLKEIESIDRVVRRYKRKYPQTRILKALRKRKQFIKPTIDRRQSVLKANNRVQSLAK
ncbi:MAG: 30S ribosomal protein S21 [Phaeodactylibacter sp.]|nr:30S ribosomal protein S21 [Phaeodactylibacter sp.]